MLVKDGRFPIGPLLGRRRIRNFTEKKRGIYVGHDRIVDYDGRAKNPLSSYLGPRGAAACLETFRRGCSEGMIGTCRR